MWLIGIKIIRRFENYENHKNFFHHFHSIIRIFEYLLNLEIIKETFQKTYVYRETYATSSSLKYFNYIFIRLIDYSTKQ